MNVASLELCEELYELSGWNAPHEKVYVINDTLADDSGLKKPHHFEQLGYGKKLGVITYYPAYDLGYLLRKLPAKQISLLLTVDGWYCTIRNNQGVGQTFEDAAAKLAIELFKQGVLTKEVA